MHLISEFCAIDGHEFSEQRIRDSLPALLESNKYGLVWLLGEPVDDSLWMSLSLSEGAH